MAASKTAVITGSTGGIGKEIARLLAADGWNLVLINRSAAKADSQREELGSAYPQVHVRTVQADLMDVGQIRQAGEDILASHSRVDALYNISGVLASSANVTPSGHDAHYAVNILAAYALTQALRPVLKGTGSQAPSMVVTMASSTIKAVKTLDMPRLSAPEEFGLFGAYATSKMALTVMGAAMADELKGENILIRSVDPGATRTSMTAGGDGMPRVLSWLAPLLFSKADKQAAKVLLAADPSRFGGRTGVLIANVKELPLPALATDPQVQSELMRKLAKDAA